jgi:tetratricopeptide (TPR) repeat protein
MLRIIIIMLIFFFWSCSQSPEYYYKRGNMFFVNGDYFKALDMYTKALLDNSDFYQAYVSRAMTYERLNNREKAKDDYQKAISINKNYLPAYNNLAVLYIEEKRYQEALYYIDKALEINPNYYYAYYNRGLINYYTGNCKNAINDFTSAINISPKDIAYYYRGLSYICIGDKNKALIDFENIKEKNDVIYFQIAKTKYEINDPTALDYISKAIEIKEDDKYYYLRAKINLLNKNFESAKNDINNAIKLADSQEKKSKYLYFGGDIFLSIGDREITKNYYDMALNFDPQSKNIYDVKIKEINVEKKNVRKRK